MARSVLALRSAVAVVVVAVVSLSLTGCVADPPPLIGTATVGDGQAWVSWQPPLGMPFPVTGYVVTPWVGSARLTPTTFYTPATRQTVTGLTNGVTYTFSVHSINALGNDSAESARSNPVTPVAMFTNLNVVAAPGGGVDFKLLSADGNFAVVQTPSGPQRVDRRDQTSVSLPTGAPSAISRDGSRVLLTSSTPVLWSNGQVLNPPPGTVLSRDLTYGVFVDTDGLVKRWESATQTVSDVETNFPRPSPVYGVHARDISDDGHMVEYSFNQQFTDVVRFADLDTQTAYDGTDSNYSAHYRLAASGTAMLDMSHLNYADLISLPSGTVLNHFYVTTFDFQILDGKISDSGDVAWVYEAVIQVPLCNGSCTISSEMVVLLPNGDTQLYFAASGDLTAGSMHIDSSGRYLLFTKDNAAGDPNPYPVQVIDRLKPGVELLTASDGSHRSRSGYINDDGTVVATTSTGGGWYEYTS
jgi:hypothetical protein